VQTRETKKKKLRGEKRGSEGRGGERCNCQKRKGLAQVGGTEGARGKCGVGNRGGHSRDG